MFFVKLTLTIHCDLFMFARLIKKINHYEKKVFNSFAVLFWNAYNLFPKHNSKR